MALHGLHMPLAAATMRVLVAAAWESNDDEVITQLISDGPRGLPACASVMLHGAIGRLGLEVADNDHR